MHKFSVRMNDSRRVANLAKHVVVQAGMKKAERDNGIFHHTEEAEEAGGRRGVKGREGGREATRGSANFFAEAEVVLPHRLRRHEQRARWSRVGVEGGRRKIK